MAKVILPYVALAIAGAGAKEAEYLDRVAALIDQGFDLKAARELAPWDLKAQERDDDAFAAQVEASAARTITSDPKRRTAYEPLYDIDSQTNASVEIFYADRALAKSFGTHGGWFWWRCKPGCLPDGPPIGPFATSYAAYRNFAVG